MAQICKILNMSKDLTARQLAEALGMMLDSSLKEQKNISERIHLQSQDIIKQIEQIKGYKIDITDVQSAVNTYKEETSKIEERLRKTCYDVWNNITNRGIRPHWLVITAWISTSIMTIVLFFMFIVSYFNQSDALKQEKNLKNQLWEFVNKDEKTQKEFKKYIKDYQN